MTPPKATGNEQTQPQTPQAPDANAQQSQEAEKTKQVKAKSLTFRVKSHITYTDGEYKPGEKITLKAKEVAQLMEAGVIEPLKEEE